MRGWCAAPGRQNDQQTEVGPRTQGARNRSVAWSVSQNTLEVRATGWKSFRQDGVAFVSSLFNCFSYFARVLQPFISLNILNIKDIKYILDKDSDHGWTHHPMGGRHGNSFQEEEGEGLSAACTEAGWKACTYPAEVSCRGFADISDHSYPVGTVGLKLALVLNYTQMVILHIIRIYTWLHGFKWATYKIKNTISCLGWTSIHANNNIAC